MSRVCQVTGKSPLVGSNVSHSNRHTKRRFEVNLRDKRFWLEDEKRWITIRVSARGMRVIDRLGLATVVAQLRARAKALNPASGTGAAPGSPGSARAQAPPGSVPVPHDTLSPAPRTLSASLTDLPRDTPVGHAGMRGALRAAPFQAARAGRAERAAWFARAVAVAIGGAASRSGAPAACCGRRGDPRGCSRR